MRSLLLVSLLACGACGGPAESPDMPPAVDRTPAAAPSSMAWEARVEGGRATLAALGEGITELEVTSLAEALGLELPTLVASRVHPDSAIEALVIDGPDGAASALALPLRAGDDAALGLRAGGPRGASWLGAG
ncbi:MAG: hypothetical protein KF901_18785, partial [Myxococcales bacterium]|nr:hypothetical protein [Myxococcales bacterium]